MFIFIGPYVLKDNYKQEQCDILPVRIIPVVIEHQYVSSLDRSLWILKTNVDVISAREISV